MSFAGQSWYPLSTWDPVPGDPAAVRAAGQGYEQVATQIQAAATNLRAIADGFRQCSEAIDEVQTKARRVADQIERARERYAATGAALVTYAGGLAQAQQIAQDALRQAQSAAAAQDNAQQDLCYWNGRSNDLLAGRPMNAPTDLIAANGFTRQADAARQDLFTTDQSLVAARAAMATAMTMRDDAAEAARASIEAVVSTDDLHDTVWQDLNGGVQEAGLWVWDSWDEITAGLGVVALALCWVPVLGEFLGAVALLAGVVLLARDIIIAFTSASDESGWERWKDVAIDAAAVVTFGLGRVAAQGLKMAATSATAAKALRATTTVAEESGAAARTSAEVAAAGTTRGGIAFHAADQFTTATQTSKVGELFGVLKPQAIFADTASDLRGGVKLFQASSSGVTNLHVGPPGNFMNAVGEGWQNAGKAFNGGSVFKAIGQDSVARDATLLARNEGFGTAFHWQAGGASVGVFGGTKLADAGLVGYNGIVALK